MSGRFPRLHNLSRPNSLKVSSMTEQSSLKSGQSVFKAEQGVSKISGALSWQSRGLQGLGRVLYSSSRTFQWLGWLFLSLSRAFRWLDRLFQRSLPLPRLSSSLLPRPYGLHSSQGTCSPLRILTQDITAGAKNFASYANRSFIMAPKFACDNALQDAIKSLATQTSLPGYLVSPSAESSLSTTRGQPLIWRSRSCRGIYQIGTAACGSTVCRFFYRSPRLWYCGGESLIPTRNVVANIQSEIDSCAPWGWHAWRSL
ncbi:hypothetical protein P692DRAFT_201031951 [Suillus brevipes Sb2]|nr:hypothetical protein P692DRAFT_201031951 [Suillus brevipes Sb2]